MVVTFVLRRVCLGGFYAFWEAGFGIVCFSWELGIDRPLKLTRSKFVRGFRSLMSRRSFFRFGGELRVHFFCLSKSVQRA